MLLQPIFDSNPELSLYIHIPWCVKKCPYCDFNSHQQPSKISEQQYLQALCSDLEQDLSLIWGRKIHSIFIGGGTPSLLSAEFYEKLLSNVRALLNIQMDAEITLEANPGTAEADRFAGYFETGINRLSLGAQSFDDHQLQKLGRIHNSEQIYRAYEMAQSAGFKRINIDVMYALPEQTVEQGLMDLHQAIKLKPQHISWYQLTLEPNTIFYSQPPSLPDEMIVEHLMEAGINKLQESGYGRYEVSAYCQPGEASKHNINYWKFGDYLGIGAGAHSKITDVPNRRILRRHKFKQPSSYLDLSKYFVASETAIESQEVPLEFMLNALRMVKGVDASLFSKNTGLSTELIRPGIEKAQRQGLMQNWPLRIQTTELGLNYLNDTLGFFFLDKTFKDDSKEAIIIKQID